MPFVPQDKPALQGNEIGVGAKHWRVAMIAYGDAGDIFNGCLPADLRYFKATAQVEWRRARHDWRES
jgi:hypothetical protein